MTARRPLNQPKLNESEHDDSNSWEKPVKKEKSTARFLAKTFTIVALSAIVLGTLINALFIYKSSRRIDFVKYNDVIADAPAYKWYYVNEFFSTPARSLFKEQALSGDSFSTIVEDKSVDTAGEAVPIGDPNCQHPFMTLNVNRTMCHFSNRLDVGMHFLRTGGFNGFIEFYDRMVTRILVFRKRLWESASLTSQKLLDEFKSKPFLDKVKSICRDNDQFKSSARSVDDDIVNEMFQLDLVLLLPGQEMPTHLNVPYFWGADRDTLPQWLLVTMKNSKLFDDMFIPQVQGLSWLSLDDMSKSTPSKTNDDDEYVDIFGEGGDFYLYPYLPSVVSSDKTESHTDQTSDEKQTHNEEKYVMLKPKDNAAVLLDGAQVIHGLDRFKPNEMPSLFAANHHYSIRYDTKRNQWQLFNFLNDHISSYGRDEVKLLVVWNMHCFANQSKQIEFRNRKNNAQQLSIEAIAQTFKRDLKSKDKLPNDDIELIDLWTIALKEYLRYPINYKNQKPTNILGVNYCLLPQIFPDWISNKLIKPYLDKIC